ncbi:thioesterase II family protein [Streptomyces sp. Ru73]|uniref:thioesterase II family protein n=1 Tax=Streptomyces sp. Ru73 TaxID=2080748 RepID=UPI0015E337D4|nr:alpha/beta fold hydrolase [Streptomyces sp. Ru73]
MSRWIRRPPRSAPPQAQLWCFPYAGGSASAFRQWTGLLPGELDLRYVQLPGRENRIREPAYEDMKVLVPDLADELAPMLRPPYYLFGHSMGARVSFALAHELRDRGLPEPAGLILSGTPAPTVNDWQPVHGLERAEFISHLHELGGIPEEFTADSAYLDRMLPVIRADMHVAETSDLVSFARPLDCPVLALAGADDIIAPPRRVEPWSLETTGPFRFAVLPGDHFYVHSRRDEVVRLVLGQIGLRG